MDFHDSRFYADLKRAMRLHIFNAVITTFLAAVMFFVLLFFIYAFLGFLNMQWLYRIIFAVFIALFVCKEMRPAFKKRDKIVSQFCGMNSGTLAAMDDRYDTMTAEFGTLFLFDEYIYFPDAMLLIPYSDIAKATAEFPRIKVMHFFRIGVGAVLKIRCMNGKKYSINIRHRKEFRDHHRSFLAALGETTAIAIKDIDYKELADKNIIAKITANCSRSEAVKKLCGKAFWLDAAKAAAADLVIMLAYWRFTSSFYFALGETRYKAFMIISTAIDIIAVIVLIFRFHAKCEEMLVRTEKFSVADLEAIEQGRVLFGTFFMLEDCLWFFWENAAINYNDIANVSAAYNISSIVRLEFSLKDKKRRRVWIIKGLEYMAYQKSFFKDLYEKIGKNDFRQISE